MAALVRASSSSEVFAANYLTHGKGDLVKRLMAVHAALRGVPQDALKLPPGLDNVAASLLDELVVRSKNKEVQQLGALALCEVLRLYAPEAPYTPEQVRARTARARRRARRSGGRRSLSFSRSRARSPHAAPDASPPPALLRARAHLLALPASPSPPPLAHSTLRAST